MPCFKVLFSHKDPDCPVPVHKAMLTRRSPLVMEEIVLGPFLKPSWPVCRGPRHDPNNVILSAQRLRRPQFPLHWAASASSSGHAALQNTPESSRSCARTTPLRLLSCLKPTPLPPHPLHPHHRLYFASPHPFLSSIQRASYGYGLQVLHYNSFHTHILTQSA